MTRKIATGVFSFVVMSVMFAGSATAQVLKDGLYDISNNTGDGVAVFRVRLEKKAMSGENAIFLIHTGQGDSPSTLSAASSDDGAKVDFRGSKDTLWVLHDNGGGKWNLLHSKNEANALSKNKDSTLKLRRNNAGGEGNADQLWKIKSTK